MRRLIIASMNPSAGKTSIIVGLGRATKKKLGFLKPFGDRMLYRKKRLWDYDAALVANIFELSDNPEDMSLGFDHSKLRFMYDEAATGEKLREMLAHTEPGKEVILIEAGSEIQQGVSVHLDPISLAHHMEAPLAIVVGGDEGTILDQVEFIHRRLNRGETELAGIIINKVQDVDDFRNTYLPAIEEMGLPLLGLIPYRKELTSLSLGFLADALFAKVITGETELQQVVRNIFVGAMSTDAALRNPFFGKEEKLVITPGDRSDMILAALEANATGIVLTNNIFPPSNIISAANEHGVPLMLVTTDTHETSKQIDSLERLLTQNDAQKIELLENLIREHVKTDALT